MTTSPRPIRRASLLALLASAALAACATHTASISPPPGCEQSHLPNCASTATGYSCTGGALPGDLDPNLTCDFDSDNGDAILFCCVAPTAPPPDSCGATTVAGCAAPALGFSCTGTFSPSEVDAQLLCTQAGSTGAGMTSYCCNVTSAPSTTGACALGPAGSVCAPGSTAYACTGASSPDAFDPTLACSNGVATPGITHYCCVKE